MADSYATIRRKIRAMRPFRGNSLEAYWASGKYIVRSYATTIAIVNPSEGAEVDFRDYSTTTSRHQGEVRAMLAANEADWPLATVLRT